MNSNALVYLAATGLVFLVGSALTIAVASVLVAADNIRRAAARRRHRRIARAVIARTDFDAALINLTKENDQ
ncbi:hypothetical protein ACI3K4_27830 [Streptomyces sp. CSMPJR101]|uniref:hypothetical protein n=1 Tax=Streptomyces sp. CSMPJR101 TaxID=1279378 RepID=UPI0038535F97